ncbi:MAG: efflux RND transporter permease subunit [Alcanivoracaceae bacterium]|nr:efflux RND transporter permease subunit [Alcanivoracaceae bacterium]
MNAIIRWFINNPAVSNLLMVMLILAGLYAIPHTRQETLPNVPMDRVNIVAPMPQATPETAERLLCTPIENALYSVEGITEIMGAAYEGLCTIRMDVAQGYDTRDILEEVKSVVGNIENLPASAQAPQISELIVRNRVARVVLSGDQDDLTLYRQAHELRQKFFDSGVISVVDFENLPDREVRIEVDRGELRRHQISLRDMATNIRRSSDAIGSGIMRSSGGDLLLETGAEPKVAEDYEQLAVRREGPGATLRVRDMARVEDGFNEDEISAWFNDKPAVALDVYRVGNQQVLDVVEEVRRQIATTEFEGNIEPVLWQDDAEQFRSRFELLKNSAFQGLIILAIMLCLFLGPRLAFWVALGIPVSMLGATAILPIAGESINTISLFAFILVLGIVVDDAIIVGESIHEVHREGRTGKDAALEGTLRVSRPVTYAVLTTLMAFAPMLFLPGAEGVLMRVIPLVAMAILALSLVESMWILPSHLSGHSTKQWPGEAFFLKLSERINSGLDKWMAGIYRPVMRRLLGWRAVVIAVFFALFTLCIVLVHSGWLSMVLFSKVEADLVMAEAVFPQGTAPANIHEQLSKLRNSAEKMAAPFGGVGAEDSPIKQIYAEQGVSQKISNARDPDAQYRIRVSLKLNGNAEVEASDIARQWRLVNGEVSGATSVKFDSNLMPTNSDVYINLFHDDLETLQKMAAELQWLLNGYHGVNEVGNNLAAQRQIMELTLTSSALDLGLTEDNLAAQVRDAFFGIEVDRIAERDYEVPVMLKLSAEDATTQWDLEELPIRLPTGDWAPLGVLAELKIRNSPAVVSHYMRERNAIVTAMVDEEVVSVGRVMSSLRSDFLDHIDTEYPGGSWGIAGKPKSVKEFTDYLGNAYLIALFGIFFLLTVLFGNYGQPILVMSAIPFGIVGSFVGHLLLGHEFTLWSLVGVVAVSGVVVNDNLVLLDCINQNRERGATLFEAVLEAGASRFRPIMLTSVTTFAGIAPMIIDNSVESRFLVPMAISLAFGVLFATLVSLILVPAQMLMAHDVREYLSSLNEALKLRWKHRHDPRPSQKDSVATAYRLGQWASRFSTEMQNPYESPELWAAWEAGFTDREPPIPV